jgi:hypothetical protein
MRLVDVLWTLELTMGIGHGNQVLSLGVLYAPYALGGSRFSSLEPLIGSISWCEFVEPGARESLCEWRAMIFDCYEAEFLLHCGHMSSYAGRDPESAVVECLRRLRYRTAMIRSGAA